MKSTRKNALAILLALLMTASALSGCSGTDDDLEEKPEALEDWNVFLVQSSSDLPACDSSTDGRLYYVSYESGFQVCSGGSWELIELTGSDGAQGPAGQAGEDGAQGPAGQAGEDGAQGPAGQAGEDGTSFSVIGSVEETSDLGEIYIGNSGDAFMVNSTVHIHVWSGSEWIDLGNISGPEGPPGTQGSPGSDGAEGETGSDGQMGSVGPEGPAGEDGEDGEDGDDGSMPIVMEMDVTISSMKFYIDSILQADVTLYRGFTYTFDQSASSNSPHPLRLSSTNDGTHGGGTQYTSGVTYTGSQGSNGLLTFTVPLDAPDTLYYYCQSHANMGGEISIQSLGSVS
ncbi:MAG: hypothetical protein CXT66_02205 [Methanobacteriota archaeon]|jgi:hypothetical protein|nr:MAG: hypothetical protein CXT66_02205 [Euryarchaeota archaeon]